MSLDEVKLRKKDGGTTHASVLSLASTMNLQATEKIKHLQ